MDFDRKHRMSRALLAYLDLCMNRGRPTLLLNQSQPRPMLYDDERKKKASVFSRYSCDWCSLRGAFPAWSKAATAAFDKVNVFLLSTRSIWGLPQGGNRSDSKAVTGRKKSRTDSKVCFAWEPRPDPGRTEWGLKGKRSDHRQGPGSRPSITSS